MNFHRCNYGASHLLTENPHHQAQLARMVSLVHCMHGDCQAHLHEPKRAVSWRQGLRPETIFGCLYEFLFEPLPEIIEMFHSELAVMQDSTLKIAMQV